MNKSKKHEFALTESGEPVKTSEIENAYEYKNNYKDGLFCSATGCNKKLIWVSNYKKKNGTYVDSYFRHEKGVICECGDESEIHLYLKNELACRLRDYIKNGNSFNINVLNNSKMTNFKKCITKFNLLNDVNGVKVGTDKSEPDIFLLKDGKPVRALDIWIYEGLINKKTELYSDELEYFEFCIHKEAGKSKKKYFDQIFEPIISDKLYPENPYSSYVNCEKCFCFQNCSPTVYCIDTVDAKRLHCFVGEDADYRHLDFSKCSAEDKSRRCSLCGLCLLQNENEICYECEIKEIQKKTAQKKSAEISEARKKNTIENNHSIKTSSTMKIESLDLPEVVKRFYIESGIAELYPPQAEAVERGLLEGKNLLAAIPTASGKTLLAELAMLKSILAGGKALYIVPLRALASEKFRHFQAFSELGVKVGISTGDYDRRDDALGSNDIIVATSEKTDSLLRNETAWMQEISVVVADEVHLIDSSNRGPTLEVTLTKLRRINPKCQILALSATIGNAKELAAWLGAELVLSEWRPTELREGVFLEGTYYCRDFERPVRKESPDAAISLVLDTLREGGQCLVFESSRKNCAAFARKAASKVGTLLTSKDREALALLAEEVLEASETETGTDLASCIRAGTAFHHAGLNTALRECVEGGFREGRIKLISSTPTLAAGLNLPARRVIVRNYRRYSPDAGMQPIPVLDYKQMAGRAGRPRLDPYGEAVLLAGSNKELVDLFGRYIEAGPEEIWSKLGTENALRTHVLSTIVNGFTHTKKELMGFLEATFFAFQYSNFGLASVVDECLYFLKTEGMLEDSESLKATSYGRLVSKLYLDPLSASILVNGLKKAGWLTDLTLLHLVCSTPDMRQLYMRRPDYGPVNDFVVSHVEEFAEAPKPFKATEYEWFLAEVKTALMLMDWIRERPENEICDRFGIGEGDIRAIADIGEWIMHVLSQLAGLLDLKGVEKAKELEKRLHYGAGPELMELLGIKGVGRVRARKLYSAGFTTLSGLLEADSKTVAAGVGPRIAARIFRQLGRPEKAEELAGSREIIGPDKRKIGEDQKSIHDF